MKLGQLEIEMFRMEFGRGSGLIAIRMEGHFVGNAARHARQLVSNSSHPSRFIPDLTAVSYMDAVGEEVLLWFKSLGMSFKADSEISRYICNRLQLPVVGKQPTSASYPSRMDDGNPVPQIGSIAHNCQH